MEKYLGDGEKQGKEEWTGSIAVRSRSFVEKVKEILGFRARGREVIEGVGGYQVKEEPGTYNAFLGAEKGDIGAQNAYFWDVTTE
ncbi:MAG: hypothetical protein JXL84_19990 [Deltaproteobacteria bacterium]|nr:hypothetical protein [Deltaproteobacteria bacterium]